MFVSARTIVPLVAVAALAAGCTAPSLIPAADRAPQQAAGAAAMPGAGPAEVKAPEAKAPEVKAPEAKAPEAKPAQQGQAKPSGKPATKPAPKAKPAPQAEPAASLTTEAMLTAPVPSLCGQPAGKLVNGTLPGIAPAHVTIAQFDGAWKKNSFHTFTSGGKTYGALVIQCNNGGVPWAQRVVVYDAKVKVVGALAFDALLGDGRQVVAGARVVERGVQYKVDGTLAEGDAACCGTIKSLVTVGVQGGKVVSYPDQIAPLTLVASDIFTAVVNGQHAVIDRYFTTAEGRKAAREFVWSGAEPFLPTCVQANGAPAGEWVCEVPSANGISTWITLVDRGWGDVVATGIGQGPAGS